MACAHIRSWSALWTEVYRDVGTLLRSDARRRLMEVNELVR